MTRGQCGWLDLHCQGLAPFTTVPAYPGAYPNAAPQPRPEAAAQRTLEAVGCRRLIMIEASPSAYHDGMLTLGKTTSSRLRIDTLNRKLLENQ